MPMEAIHVTGPQLFSIRNQFSENAFLLSLL